MIIWLAGWSTPASVWQVQTKYWPAHSHLLLDFLSCQTTLDFAQQIDHKINELAPASFIVVGWSLGAMLALQLAPLWTPRLRGLFLVGATSRFVKTETSAYGWPKRVLARMNRQLQIDSQESIRAFDQQMFSRSEWAQGDGELWHSLYRQQAFSVSTLQLGLSYLQTYQMHPACLEERIPIHLLQGAEDRITPPEAALHLARQLPNAFCTIMKDAGHLPFWTQQQAFAQWMRCAYEQTVATSV